MSIGAEQQEVLRIVSCALSGASYQPHTPSTPTLVNLLRHHHLRPLAHALGAKGLEASHQECAVLAAFHRRCLDEVGREFQRLNIRWTAIKGAAYAWTLYAEPELRPMSDLDLLVPENDFGRACKSLAALGFRERQVSTRTRHAQTFSRAPHEIIDLHRSILQPMRGTAPVKATWGRSRPSSLHPGYSQLDVVDHACIHLAHMARHEFVVPLISYIDMHRLHASLSNDQQQTFSAELRYWRLGYAHEVANHVIREILLDPTETRPAIVSSRTRLIMPTRNELTTGSHRSRAAQVAKKLALFPRDTATLAIGWALRSAEDRLLQRP